MSLKSTLLKLRKQYKFEANNDCKPAKMIELKKLISELSEKLKDESKEQTIKE